MATSTVKHSWEAQVCGRSRDTGCPQCSNRKVCKHNCLETKAPGLQLNGNAKCMTLHKWWLEAINLLVGSVMPEATSGMQDPVSKQKLAAHNCKEQEQD